MHMSRHPFTPSPPSTLFRLRMLIYLSYSLAYFTFATNTLKDGLLLYISDRAHHRFVSVELFQGRIYYSTKLRTGKRRFRMIIKPQYWSDENFNEG